MKGGICIVIFDTTFRNHIEQKLIVLYITIMQTQSSTGCVINGGTHTHIYGAYHAEQQAKIDELSASVTGLVDIVDRLTRLVADCCKVQQPKPEPQPTPTQKTKINITIKPSPVPVTTYEPPADMYTPESDPESDSESESEQEYNSDESDAVDPDQPISEEQSRLLEEARILEQARLLGELKDISSARAQLKHSGASKSKFLKLNKRKAVIHTKQYSHQIRPSTPELMEELVSPPAQTQNP